MADATEKQPRKSMEESVASLSDDSSNRSSRDSSSFHDKEDQPASRPASQASRAHRARSLLSRSLSRTQSHTQPDEPELLTRTVSEVRDGIYYVRDVPVSELAREKNADLEAGDKVPYGDATAAESEADPNLVRWDGPEDPENPKNWRSSSKWAAMSVISLYTFMTPVASSMIAPALSAIASDLHITSSSEQQLTMSVFLLAFAIGPLFMSPLSEMYGRVRVLQLSNLFFLFFNLGCGLAQTRDQMIVFRFFAGLGGSAPLGLGGGLLSDLFVAEQRGRAMSMFSLAPLLGPAVGPIMGAFITQQTSWRWIFYATTIADAVVQVVGAFLLRETYAPVLLARRRARLARETGNAALYTTFERERGEQGLARALSVALRRPFVMLGTQPIVQVLALYMMYLYGLMYLMLSTFSELWRNVYGMSLGMSGLQYLAPGIGFALGAQLLSPLQDRIYVALKRRYGVAVGRPEFRIPIMLPGAFLVPVGLFVYGWCAEARTAWILPDIGVAIMATGLIAGFQCIQGYLVDTYSRFAASAVSATTVMRSLAAFGFPLFAPTLFERLGYGGGNSLLAGFGIIIGWPAPFLLWKYGELLRKKSPYASG